MVFYCVPTCGVLEDDFLHSCCISTAPTVFYVGSIICALTGSHCADGMLKVTSVCTSQSKVVHTSSPVVRLIFNSSKNASKQRTAKSAGSWHCMVPKK